VRDIIFIAGRGRSGSTLLGKMLETSHDAFHIGEIRYFVQIGWKENRECECGERLKSCPFWGGIIDLCENYNLEEVYAASKGLPTHTEIFLRDISNLGINYSNAYLSFLNDLYQFIVESSNAKYIIDSSKFPVYLKYVMRLQDVDIRVIYLTRDPRGTSYSWSKIGQRSKGQSSSLVGRHSFLEESLKWRLWNNIISKILDEVEHHVHVQWEDVLANPDGELEKIVHSLNLEMKRPVFESPSHIRLSRGHAFWGNSSRRLHGMTEIRKDEEWRQHMPAWKKSLIHALSGASGFGYER